MADAGDLGINPFSPNERHGPSPCCTSTRSWTPWDAYFGAPYTHGTLFRRAAEEGLVDVEHSVHVGIRGPLYVSLDIDVLDPTFAPGTGTPEAGGLSSAQLLEMLCGLERLNIVGADVVEVAPAYDHAKVTGIAAAHVTYELLSLLPGRPA